MKLRTPPPRFRRKSNSARENILWSPHWPIENVEFEQVILRYLESRSKEDLDLLTTNFLLPLCQHRFVDEMHYRFDHQEAVDYALDECLERLKPADVPPDEGGRRLGVRTGVPIVGFEPNKISIYTDEPITAFAFFSTVAKRAFCDLNRQYTAKGKQHKRMLEQAYNIARHNPLPGDNIGQLYPSAITKEEIAERRQSAAQRYHENEQLAGSTATYRCILQTIRRHEAEVMSDGRICVDVLAKKSKRKPAVVRVVLEHFKYFGKHQQYSIRGEL